MTNFREALRLKSLGFNNVRIAESCGLSRTTVIDILKKADAAGINFKTALNKSDRELTAQLSSANPGKIAYKMPDYELVHQEMAKSGVTLSLLWFEYCDKCRENGEIPYQQTQFKKYYREFIQTTKATMHINRKPGEILEVDWAGQTAKLTDTETGEQLPAYVFVASLPYSGYSYVEAFLSRSLENWIEAHVNAYKYFGGVSRILVPDNLKTGVIKHTMSEVVLNRTYHEIAEYYGTAVIPTRVKTPKDKATVEGCAGIISTWILAAIRNQQFLSIGELNAVIHEKLSIFNGKPFQKKDGTRAELFEEERLFLIPLPAKPYEMSEWKTATVQYNYHVSVDYQNYSAPYEYIKRAVDVRLTKNIVEALYEGERICSHPRLYGRRGQYESDPSHMPHSHRQYAKWTGDKFRNWAASIGPNTSSVANIFLGMQQGRGAGVQGVYGPFKAYGQAF
jgi:transposase